MASRPTRHRYDPQRVTRCVSQKVGYSDKAAALDVAEQMMDEGRVKPGCHITPYRCSECREWHVANRVIVWLDRRRRTDPP